MSKSVDPFERDPTLSGLLVEMASKGALTISIAPLSNRVIDDERGLEFHRYGESFSVAWNRGRGRKVVTVEQEVTDEQLKYMQMSRGEILMDLLEKVNAAPLKVR